MFNSRLKLFPGKLKSRWSGPFKLLKIYPRGDVDLLNENTRNDFKDNDQRVRNYLGDPLHNARTTIDLND